MQIGLTRRNIGRLVLLAWAVALAWLARRELGGGPVSTADRVRALEPGAQYFAVLAGDRQIGQLNRTLDTLVDGVRLTELLVLDVPEGDSTRQLARLVELELSRGLRLRRLVRSVFGIGSGERQEGVLGPDSLISIRNFEADVPAGRVVRIAAGADPVVPVMLPLRAALDRRLEPGIEFRVPRFDLGSGMVEPLDVRVTAESTFVVADSAVWNPGTGGWVPATFDTIRAFRLEHRASGPETVTWVDEQGALVEETVRGGYRLRRSAFEIVNLDYRQLRRSERSHWRSEIPGMRGLAASGRAPVRGNPPGRLVARDSSELFPNPRPWAPDSAADLPGRWVRSSWDQADRESSALVPATRSAVAGATSLTDSVARLAGWVGSEIQTDPGGWSTASNTLDSRRGSPDGKARLFVSMARAARLPARVIRGVALQPDGAFGHTWAEVWIGQWVAVDPAFGTFPAPASLVPVGIGDRSRPVDLIPVLASARFLPRRTPR